LRIGIPDLERYSPHRGIGRTISTLVSIWSEWGHEIVPIPSRTSRLLVLRNLKWGLHGSLRDLDVIFFGDLPGAEALFFLPKDIPSVVMVHDVGVIDCAQDRAEATLLTRPLYRLSLRAACRSMRSVAISDFTRGRLISHSACLAHKTRTVYYGVDHGVFYPRDRSVARSLIRSRGVPVSDQDFIAMYAGAEYARKNLSTLVEAFALLHSRLPSARLLKVGSSHSEKNRLSTLGRMQQLGLAAGRDVIFVDDIDDSILPHFYCGADMYVSTSRYEGFGLPLLEAMSCGLPCVVSNAGALPEVGGDAALYVDPDDAIGFADRMEEVARSQHDDLVGRALARAAEFDWEKTSGAILQVLQIAAAHGSVSQL